MDGFLVGGPACSFETLHGASVLHLRSLMTETSRRGLSTSAVFAADTEVRLEVRFNTLVQSPDTAWDQLPELWILDARDLNCYDIVNIFGCGFGVERQFSGTPTVSDFLFRKGNDNKPYGNNRNNPNDDWPWAPDPTAITVHEVVAKKARTV